MTYRMNDARLREENRQYRGTTGVSQCNRDLGYLPAFCDCTTGRCEPSRFADGSPAPIHLIVGLPDDWVVERDEDGRPTAVKGSVVAGFLRDGRFFTREQAAAAAYH